MDPRRIREFARRDWEALRKSKRKYWTDRLAADGVDPLLHAAESLRELVRSVHPDWPRGEERDADYDHHVSLKHLLDRARDAFSSR